MQFLRVTKPMFTRWTPRFAMNHIKDMREENVRVQM